MKGGREETGKVMSPLFPRLHVNDADKGGPRAPPRNKMALYEQFTIPSQRFGGKSVVPLAPAPPPSGCVQEGTIFPSYYMPHKLSHANKEFHPQSVDTKNTKNSMRSVGEKKSIQPGAYRSASHLPSSMDSGPFPLPESKNSSRKRVDDEDDFRVPTFVHSMVCHSSSKDRLPIGNSLGSKTSENGVGNNCSFSSQLPTIREKPSEESSPSRLVTRKRQRDHSQHKGEETVNLKEHRTHLDLTERLDRKNSELFLSRELSDCENGTGNAPELEKPSNEAKKICYNFGTSGGVNCNIDSQRCSDNFKDAEESESSRVQHKVRTSDAKNPVDTEMVEDSRIEYNGPQLQDQGSLEKDEDSESSMLDSESGLDISPDDVAKMIGVKHFWKARRVILNQQRVFALQVFELHRLIKVQKLIAASPQLLLQGASHETRSNTFASTNPADITGKLQPLVHEKESSQNPDDVHITESSNGPPFPLPITELGRNDDSQKSENDEHIVVTSSDSPSSSFDEQIVETSKEPPVSSLRNMEHNLNKGSAIQAVGNVTHSGVSTASENSPNPWCLPTPMNGWLVPVMSPSEGLVYKPCTGPYPPAMGLIPPVLGGLGSVGMPSIVGDFMTYGFPSLSHHNASGCAPVIAPGLYPVPCGFPFVNPCASSDTGPMSPFLGSQPKERSGTNLGSSGNLVKPRVDDFSASSRCIQASRGSDMLGSTASSNSEKLHEVMDMSVPSSQVQIREQQTRVIKVVPHNPRRATESAARIFKSIQRERQLCDSV